MNKRSREILSRILAKKDYQQEISIEELTNLYGVSSRTIRYDINQINDFLEENKISKIMLGKNGVLKTKEDFFQSRNYLMEEEFYTFKLAKNEREVFVSVLLVSADDFLTLSELADDLMVSRSTIIQDVERVKELVRKWNLSLNSYPNRGLLLEGNERDKRRFMIHFIRSQTTIFKNGPLFYHLLNMIQEKQNIVVAEEMIEKVINEAEHAFGLFLTDNDFDHVKYYLILALYRMKQGCHIESYISENIETERMALGILKQIDIFTSIVINPGEVAFLSNFLGELRYLKRTTSNKEIVKIQVITRKFIEQVSKKLKIDLNSDYIFYENLTNHLESTFSQINLDFEVSNIVKEVLKEYPEVVKAAKESKEILEQYIKRSLESAEIAYIVVHICAAIERNRNSRDQYSVLLVCHGGIGTSQLLLERLRKYFNFHVVDVVSSHDLEGRPLDEVDLVISTIPLEHAPMKYIQVSPMLSDEDCIKVGKLLSTVKGHEVLDEEKEKQKKLIQKISMYINDYDNKDEMNEQITKELRRFFGMEKEVSLSRLLTRQAIETDVECETWEDAIRASARYLLENDYIEERYVDAMIENVKTNGPYMVIAPGFALPHEAIDSGAKKLGMSLIRLKKPISFHHFAYDPIEWVCCLSTIDKEMHLKAMFHLVNLLHNDVFRFEIAQAGSSNEIAEIIKKYESR